MTPAELQRVRDALQRMHHELVEEGAFEVRAELDTPVASSRDQDEAPLVEMGQSIASARNRERTRRIEQIVDALRRLHDEPDEFGLCDACSEPIPARRLELMPFAKLCVPCQSQAEGPRGGHVRKKITDYV